MGDSTPEETAAGGDGEVKAAGDFSAAVDEKTEDEAVPGEGAEAAKLGTEKNSEEKQKNQEDKESHGKDH